MEPAIFHSVDHILDEVRAMRVKGGSAFGVAAAHAFRFVALDQKYTSNQQLYSELDRVASLLLAEKPTMGTVHNAYQLIVTSPRSELNNDDIAGRDAV